MTKGLAIVLVSCAAMACRQSTPHKDILPDVAASHSTPAPAASSVVPLPPADTSGTSAFESLVSRRRSVRQFAPDALTPAQLGQLLWAGQGITDRTSGHRAVPSAGALYPIELYAITPDGMFHYLPSSHSLERRSGRDLRRSMYEAGLRQQPLLDAPCTIVVASVTARTRHKYGEKASRFAAVEAGHVGQNVLLQAVSLGLAGVPVGGYDDDAVKKAIDLPVDQDLLYLLPVGKAK